MKCKAGERVREREGRSREECSADVNILTKFPPFRLTPLVATSPHHRKRAMWFLGLGFILLGSYLLATVQVVKSERKDEDKEKKKKEKVK